MSAASPWVKRVDGVVSGEFATEVMDLLQADPTPHEILVQGVLMHRWAERDGTYDELVAQRSQALAMLPSHQ